jgi:hypothetical protein
MLFLVAAAGAPAQDFALGLRGLAHVALEISLGPELTGLKEGVAQRMERVLQKQPRGPAVDPRSPDTLRLVATVRAANATELRGFWLPFSGTYAIGSIRLEVERRATISGATAAGSSVRAIVWQRERLIARPWRQAEAEIDGAVDELIGIFLAEYRQAQD